MRRLRHIWGNRRGACNVAISGAHDTGHLSTSEQQLARSLNLSKILGDDSIGKLVGEIVFLMFSSNVLQEFTRLV